MGEAKKGAWFFMAVLVTGGAGYIGSHTCIELLQANTDVVIIDNFINSHRECLRRMARITGRTPILYKADYQCVDVLHSLFQTHDIDTVIHFAAHKAVGQSVQQPLSYYQNNVSGTITLLEIMREYDVKQFVFSSSATVYGNPSSVPITEDAPLSAVNPYGQTKLMIERVLEDVYHSDPRWRIVALRYFNPIGAHESGLIGEDPTDIPNNLVPYIARVAVGQLKKLSVFGNDYPTKDGTGVRDYIHVTDLAKGHVKALEYLKHHKGHYTVNLGTGKGYSVLEVVEAFEKASKKSVPYVIAPRREGDVAVCYADPTYAERLFGWKAMFDLEKMCEDTWRWQSNHPKGYRSG